MSWLKKLLDLVRREPVVIAHVVTAGLTFAAAFGFNLDAKTIAEIMAGVQLVTALITRTFTTPVASAPAASKVLIGNRESPSTLPPYTAPAPTPGASAA